MDWGCSWEVIVRESYGVGFGFSWDILLHMAGKLCLWVDRCHFLFGMCLSSLVGMMVVLELLENEFIEEIQLAPGPDAIEGRSHCLGNHTLFYALSIEN